MPKKQTSPEKLLDMIRGILPSTARGTARRAKARKSREVRRRVRMTLYFEDAEETKADLREQADQRYTVQDRRAADKVNSFMRWCESWTRGMTERQALDSVRALLPRNLIGDHAFTHWEAHLKYRKRRSMYPKDHYDRQWQSRYDKTRHRLRQALSVDPGFQTTLNTAIKERKELDEPRRLLLGIHDVDAFVRAVLTLHGCCKEERVLLGLLEEAEQGSAGIPAGRYAGILPARLARDAA